MTLSTGNDAITTGAGADMINTGLGNDAVAKVMHATWPRCRVHFMRNALAHANKSGKRMVNAFIRHLKEAKKDY